MSTQASFEIERALCLIREADRPFPKPAAYALPDEGFDSRFEQLVACIISIRTRDELSDPAARALLQHANTPTALCRMTPEAIDSFLTHTVYHKRKFHWIQETVCRIVHQYLGMVPCNDKPLLAFNGVGLKCANVVLALAFGKPVIIVEMHVQRPVNAWATCICRHPGRRSKRSKRSFQSSIGRSSTAGSSRSISMPAAPSTVTP
jgi:endonuclease-3